VSGADIKVGLAYDIGGRGDQSFNDSAAAGLDKAVADYGVQTKELEATGGETDAQKEERLTSLADAGYNPIIAVGFAYSVAMDKVAKAYPDVNFAIIDDAASALPNLANLVFAENQGSYLVGAIAAQASKTGNIGFIGGVNVPLIQKFQAGYEAGAKAINPDIKIQAKYLTEPPDFSGFGDPAKGKVAAEGMFQGGADVVYHAAGGSGGGVFDAAKKAKGWAIGVDSDQFLTASADVKDVILTSMLKRVDVAVYDFVGSAVNGAPLTGVQTFDLAKDGVGYSTSNPAVDPYKAKTDELAAQIIDGTITVPDTMS
jgi:basic membrane protein A